jgi:hypothetical protein
MNIDLDPCIDVKPFIMSNQLWKLCGENETRRRVPHEPHHHTLGGITIECAIDLGGVEKLGVMGKHTGFLFIEGTNPLLVAPTTCAN